MPIKILRITTPVPALEPSTRSTPKRKPILYSTRKTSPPAPLEVYELLEQILLLLPMRDLLLSQRVCRRWRHVIVDSKPIQRALHFLPVSDDTPGRYENPLLFDEPPFCDYFGIGIMGDEGGLTGILMVGDSHSGWKKGWPKAFRYTEASWRRMQLTQPLVESFIVEDFRVAPVYDDVLADIVQNKKGGVVMGDMLLLEEVVD
ncbi:hypothetical protein P154DRAFT_258943 [Amniculicola lignicola CBS 123094]|uniref:F-box domain-containing protein n=1 Tax=Amniculicola lignicola CBS 123094 TaxID=1392246 RepID=A0A6A5WZI5_9PLEO|nr:hypothetical protein P154DRAFT_258943 [Amniculicola lignicola CBS 123094]